MSGTTKFKGNVEATEKILGEFDGTLAITESTYKVTSDDATAAAGTAPTKAEFDAVVTLVNEIKADYNKLVKKLATGSTT